MNFIYHMTRRRTLRTQKTISVSSSYSFSVGLMLYLSSMCTGCHLFLKATTQPNSEDVSYQTTPTQTKSPQELVIQRAAYSGVLTQSQEGKSEEASPTLESTAEGYVRIKAQLLLSSQDRRWDVNSERSITLNVPKRHWSNFEIDGDCRLDQGGAVTSQGGVKRTFRCRASAPNQATLNVSYVISWPNLTGHHVITEGERQYHIVHLAAPLGGEVFLGFSEPRDFPREVTLKAVKSLQLFGHEVSGLASLREMVLETQPSSTSSPKSETSQHSKAAGASSKKNDAASKREREIDLE